MASNSSESTKLLRGSVNRGYSSIIPAETVDEFPRIVYCNNDALNEPLEYPSNRISSTKYSILTFLPKNMFEQFRRIANFYFLLICVLQLIPEIRPGGFTPVTSILPLVFVLTVSAVKEAYEDILRYRADKRVNEEEVSLVKNGTIVTVQTQDVIVGNIVQIKSDEVFPADLLLLSSSKPDGSCFIETSNLDGETSLKPHAALKCTTEYNDAGKLHNLSMYTRSKKPTIGLSDTEGQIIFRDDRSHPYGFSAENVLLRGAKLKITQYIFGLVLYTGPDSKLILNQQPAPSKFSHVEKMLNRCLVMVFVVLMVLCVTSTFLSVFWELTYGHDAWYLDIRETVHESIIAAIPRFFTFICLYNYLIPISLYVSVELVKLVGARMLEWDIKMYCEETDTPAVANTSNLLEELGQVQFVFSDKTGTLTENKMRLDRCSINGSKYDASPPPHKQEALKPTDRPDASEVGRPLLCESIDSEEVKEFCTALALAHEVQVVNDKYEATIPDDDALVKGAAAAGVKLLERGAHHMVLDVAGQRTNFQILHLCRFSSDRARMSIVVRMPDESIMLFAKGSDQIIKSLLANADEGSTKQTFAHVDEYAAQGLRTICFAKRPLSEQEYEDFCHLLQQAEHAASRQEMLNDAYGTLECSLHLIGATAIEDCLQQGVPETIEALINAGMKVWVLTGDKRDTAINIATRCRLLQPSMHRFACYIPDGVPDKQIACEQVLDNALDELRLNPTSAPSFALVIDGHSLSYALTDKCKPKLLELSQQCKSVVCCRVSPKQKSLVVDMVRHSKAAPITLAIGDGANDVSMIQTAHLGVGIKGKEGMQAARASDYAIGQFRFLRRLLFVHGRFNYIRIATLVQYSFYKNIVFSLPLFYYSFYSGYSGQTVYDPWLMMVFNIVYTAAPIVALAVFDKDVPDHIAERNDPDIYKRSKDDTDFNLITFCVWMASAAWHSVVVYFGTSVLLGESISVRGSVLGLYDFGTAMLSICIVIVTIKIALHTRSWTWVNHFFYWGSILLYFILLVPFCMWLAFEPVMFGIIQEIGSQPRFWLSIVVLTMIAIVPEWVTKTIRIQFYPHNWHLALEREHLHKTRELR